MKKQIGRLVVLTALILAAAMSASAAGKDEVLSIIQEAVGQYEKGDYTGAANNLDYASRLIRQKKGEAIKTYLPEPLPGWEAGEAQAQAVGTAILGGGINVSRNYTRDQASVSIEIVTDSPLMQSLVMMMNNPMLAGAGGGKLITINGQRAMVQFSEESGSGEISIVVANRFLVTVRGNDVARSELMAYAEAIDYKKLANRN